MHGGIMMFLVTPISIFLLFVAPIWLYLHYRSKRQLNQGLTEEEYRQLENLSQQANLMAQRITSLESILDHEVPQWREQE